MKRLSLYLFLILFTLQTPSQADDIRDFQIEGMSIGDSALDYFSEKEIKKNSKNYYKNKKYTPVENNNFSFFQTYDAVDLRFKTNDKKYIIQSIAGVFYYDKNVKDCYKRMDQVVKDIKEFLDDIEYQHRKLVEKHSADKSGKSKVTSSYFDFESKDMAYVQCYDYSDESGWGDHLKVGIATKEFVYFLENEAYK